MLLAIAAAVAALPLGSTLGFVRDQGQPYYLTEEEKERLKAAGKLWSKWKESGLALFGLIFGGLVAWRYGVDLQHAALWGAGVAIWTAIAWSKGHEKGLDLSNALDWLAMAGTGLAVTASVGAAMVWHGDVVLGLLAGSSGALKAPAYWLGYRIRGRGWHPWPHATAIGACVHGATALAVPVFAVLASAQ